MPLSNFSLQAKNYEENAFIQKKTAESLVKKTSQFLAAKNLKIADLGCGPGVIGKYFEHSIKVPFTLNNCDTSKEMLAHAQKAFLSKKNHRFTLDSLPNDNDYDLIISNFALQWYDDINNAIKIAISKLKPNGLLSLCLPIVNSFEHLHQAFKYVNVEDAFFKFPEVKNIHTAIKPHQIIYEDISTETELHNNTLSFLKSLHIIGANQSEKKLSPTKLKKIIQYHDALFNEKIIVSYKIYKVIIKRDTK